MTLCTVAIPVYNREHLVRGALESALAQDIPGLEILVVDNASTDGTWDILRSYSDPRLRLVRNEHNVGLYNNLNRCLELAQGEYLRLLCSDDRLTPGCLADEIAILQQAPGVVMVSTRAQKIDTNNAPIEIMADDLPPGIYPGRDMIGHAMWYTANYMHNPLNYPSGILLRRESALRAGRFPDSYRLVGDMVYWIRLFALGDVAILDHVGCEIMVHDAQEGLNILNSGLVVDEYFALFAQCRDTLRAQNLEQAVRKMLCGAALWIALMFVKRRRLDIARLYWKTATSKGYAPWTLLFATLRFIWQIKILHYRNVRYTPRLVYQPLPGTSGPPAMPSLSGQNAAYAPNIETPNRSHV